MKSQKFNNILKHLHDSYDLKVLVKSNMNDKIFSLEKFKKEFYHYDKMIEEFVYDAIKNPNITCINSPLNLDFEGLTSKEKLLRALMIDIGEFQHEMLERYALEKSLELADKIKQKCDGYDYSKQRAIPNFVLNELIELAGLHKFLIDKAMNPFGFGGASHIGLRNVFKNNTKEIYYNYVKLFDIVYQYVYGYVLHSATKHYNFTIEQSKYSQVKEQCKKNIRIIDKDRKNNKWLVCQRQYIQLKVMHEFHFIKNHFYAESRALITGVNKQVEKCYVVNPIYDNLRYEVSKDSKASAIEYKNVCMMIQKTFRQKMIKTIFSDKLKPSFFFNFLFLSIEETYFDMIELKMDFKHFEKGLEKYLEYQLKEDFNFFLRSQEYDRLPLFEIVDKFIQAHCDFIDAKELSDINIMILDIVLEIFRHIHKLDSDTANFTKEYIDEAMKQFFDNEVLSVECRAWYERYYEDIYHDDFGDAKKPV
ncbi:hypothetical protein L7E35_004625 [Vibrio parahaemolyticus]|nr:hypothetical protein [Vibrio parahaemolyticus]EIV1599679.1 hypothetical protein [Vibrio parahaemolyticus]